MISSVVVSQAKRLDSLITLITRLKRVTDETVIILDNADSDICEAIKDHADKVAVIPNKGFYELYTSDIYENCSHEWILRIDDDEMLDEAWTREALQELINDDSVTHYWFPRRWFVNDGEYIQTTPWFPDYQLRLFRNDRSIAVFPKEIHDMLIIDGNYEYADALFIDHYDLMLQSHDQRLNKCKKYMKLQPYKTFSLKYYLYEEYSFDLTHIKPERTKIAPPPGLRVLSRTNLMYT